MGLLAQDSGEIITLWMRVARRVARNAIGHDGAGGARIEAA